MLSFPAPCAFRSPSPKAASPILRLPVAVVEARFTENLIEIEEGTRILFALTTSPRNQVACQPVVLQNSGHFGDHRHGKVRPALGSCFPERVAPLFELKCAAIRDAFARIERPDCAPQNMRDQTERSIAEDEVKVEPRAWS